MDRGDKLAVLRPDYLHKDFLIGVAGLTTLGLYSMTVGPLAERGGPIDYLGAAVGVALLVLGIAIPRVEVYERRVEIVWTVWRHRVPRDEVRGVWVRHHRPPFLLLKTPDDSLKGWAMQLDRAGVVRLIRLLDVPLFGEGDYLETWRAKTGGDG